MAFTEGSNSFAEAEIRLGRGGLAHVEVKISWRGATYVGGVTAGRPHGFGELRYSKGHPLEKYYALDFNAGFNDNDALNPNAGGVYEAASQQYVLRGLFRNGVFLADCVEPAGCPGDPLEGQFYVRFESLIGPAKFDRDSESQPLDVRSYRWSDMHLGSDRYPTMLRLKTPRELDPVVGLVDLYRDKRLRKVEICGSTGCSSEPVAAASYVGPQPVRLWSDAAMTKVALDVAVSFPQWDRNRRFWGSHWAATDYLIGAMNVVEIKLDGAFNHPRVAKVVGVCRFSQREGSCEPVAGYIDRAHVFPYLIDRSKSIDDNALEWERKRPSPDTAPNGYFSAPTMVQNEILERVVPAPIRALPYISPYRRFFPLIDSRRSLAPRQGQPLTSYGFLRIEGALGSCSATLVGNRLTVATAGHCITSRDATVLLLYQSAAGLVRRQGKVVVTPHFDDKAPRLEAALGTDKKLEFRSLKDWALIRLDSPFPEEVKPVPLANFGRLQNPAHGNPLLYGTGFPGDVPYTSPTLSPCPPSKDIRATFGANEDWHLAIQVEDCALFKGNSGGALIALSDGVPQFLGVLTISQSAFDGCQEMIGTSITNVAEAADRFRRMQHPKDHFFMRHRENTLTESDKEDLSTAAGLMQSIAAAERVEVVETLDRGGSVNCKYPRYSAPLIALGHHEWYVASRWMVDEIERIGGRDFDNDASGLFFDRRVPRGHILHTWSEGLRALRPRKLDCVFRRSGGLDVNSLKSVDASSGCDVTAKLRSAFRISQFPGKENLGAMVKEGALVLFDKRSGRVAAAYAGVMERCMADRFLCQMHIVLPALN